MSELTEIRWHARAGQGAKTAAQLLALALLRLVEIQEAAVELLGRKVDAASIRAAVAEGYAWLS